jgi:malonyl-CoA O-methyltransferase
VLKPGGMLLFSTFGPDTLRELRAAWAEVDQHSHVSRFLDMHDVGDAMLAAGLRDPVLDVDRYTLTYSEPASCCANCKGLGATNADRGRERASPASITFSACSQPTKRCASMTAFRPRGK